MLVTDKISPNLYPKDLSFLFQISQLGAGNWKRICSWFLTGSRMTLDSSLKDKEEFEDKE